MGAAWAMNTWTVSSESELESSASAILVEALLGSLPDNLLDNLPDNLPEEELLDLALDPDVASSSCSFLSVQHFETSCPLHLQWEHFFTSPLFFPLPVLLVK